MTSFEIEVFLSIVSTGSLTAAAEQLHVTQPALSRRLSLLEQELGTQLILRQKGIRTVRLTRAGEAFIPVAEKWKNLFTETAAVSTSAAVRQLRVATVGSVGSYLLPNIFRQFLMDQPGIQLKITERHSYESYGCVSSGEVDIAFINHAFYSGTLKAQPLFLSPMQLVMNGTPDGPAYPSRMDIRREIRLPWTVGFDAWHDSWYGPNAPTWVTLDQMNLLEQLLDEPGAWAVAPAFVAAKLTANPCLTVCDWQEGPPPMMVSVLSRPLEPDSPGELFMETIRKRLPFCEGVNPV